MRLVLAGLALTASVVACSPARLRLAAPDVPEDVAWIALLGENDTTAFADGTGLLPWRPPVEVELDGSAEGRFWLYAFRTEDLAEFELPSEAELARAKIRFAKSTDAILPAGWVGSGVRVEDSVSLSVAEDSPLISAPWLPACPQLLEEGKEGYADLRCAPPCHASVRQLGCGLEIDLGACSFPEVSGGLDGRGRFTSKGEVIQSCDLLPSSDEYVAALSCVGGLAGPAQCRLELHDAVQGEPFRVESRRIHGAPVMSPSAHFLAHRRGYLTGMVLLDDSVAVGGHGGSSSGYGCDSSPPVQSEVVFLDQESLETVTTTTLSDCLTALGPHPSGGVLVAVGVPAAQVLTHISASGEFVRSVELPTEIEDTEVVAVDIVAFRGRVAVLVVDMPVLNTSPAPSYLLIYDEALAEPPLISAPLTRYSDRMVASDLGLAVINRDSDELLVFDEQARLLRRDPYDDPCGLGPLRSWWLSAEPGLGALVSFGLSSSGALGRLSGDRPYACVWGTYFEGPATSYAAVRATSDSPYLVVGLNTEDGRDLALLTRFDFTSGRFIQPSQVVGKGVISEAKRDRVGRLWFLLPEDDLVVRAE